MSDSSDSTKSVVSRKDEHVTTRRTQKRRLSTVHNDSRHYKIKVPPFSPEDPELWFALLEGQFKSNSVTDDCTKFTHVTNHLDLQYAKAVKDIIVKPPTANSYEKIKTELIKRLSASHEKKVKQLLTHEELGDRKPSQFLRHLRDLAGPSVPEEFIRSIWSNRLPHEIQTVLASQPTHSLEQLADLADRIQELTFPHTIASTSTHAVKHPPVNEIDELKKMVQQLTLKLDEHTRTSCCATECGRYREHRRTTSSRQRSRSRSSYVKYPVCWYHTKFGSDAKKCVKPCDYSKSGKAQGSR